MVKTMHPGDADHKRKVVVTKEFIVGFLAILIGGYNLLPYFGLKAFEFSALNEPMKVIANAVLVLAGLILWLTAYKLWRYRWHSSRIF